MKKKSLSVLLQKLEEAQLPGLAEIANLTDQLSKKMIKAGYAIQNGICNGSTNTSCSNTSCTGNHNVDCSNGACLI
jgi:hypothetical protein